MAVEVRFEIVRRLFRLREGRFFARFAAKHSFASASYGVPFSVRSPFSGSEENRPASFSFLSVPPVTNTASAPSLSEARR